MRRVLKLQNFIALLFIAATCFTASCGFNTDYDDTEKEVDKRLNDIIKLETGSEGDGEDTPPGQ